ncbi:clock controled protein (ccg-8) [Moniliophthora roreri MCA 2997]|nr:clock controled protein (ccg-8) [Moniliophthora roreri MCA 2997]
MTYSYGHQTATERNILSSSQDERERTSRSATPTSADHYEYHPQDYREPSSSSQMRRRRSPSQPRPEEGSPREGDHQQQTQITQRGRWQTMLVEAGGLSVAFSEESMKKLKYCLNWLQWAIQHIDAQILFLREFTVSLQQQYLEPVQEENDDLSPTTPTASSSTRSRSRRHVRTTSASISEAHHRKLNDVRKDVVHTIRQVVGVVSKYAGEAALPEPARNTVKGFILMLPKKWAEAVRVGGGPGAAGGAGVPSFAASSSTSGGSGERESVTAAASGRAGSDRRAGHLHGDRWRGVSSSASAAASPVSSRTTSPAASPRVHTRPLAYSEDVTRPGSERTMSAGTAMVTAQRILALATESLDMMRGVTGVVKDSLDKAEAWVERLRRVGYHRAVDGTPIGEGPPDSDNIPMEDRRDGPSRSSSSTDLGDHDREHRRYGIDSPPEGMLSPLYLSRRGSMSDKLHSAPPESPYSTHSTLGGPGSVPGTPALPTFSSLALPVPVDAPSPGVGGGMKRMSITEVDTDIIPTKEAKIEDDEKDNVSTVGDMDVDQ